ncbi:di-heme oxidoredictase family protein [Phocaeicola coprocola]|uniref:di-heme oxidoredictase family protein n=1 Tax=Phocaeicola coprocola TaxID=310298 RepID=UPI002941E457|nr:di-heme oxidoredictase family protein [Phocaeicola coprocola]
MKTKFLYLINSLFVASAITACSDNENQHVPSDNPENNEKPEWYYTGGQLGTAFLTTSNALEQPTEPIEANEEMSQRFKNGEQLFEKMYMNNHSGVRKGLGPAYVRSSCIHCHPGYGHGKRNPAGAFQTTSIGNGCLLVVYNPDTDGYVSWLTGMPQGHATQPFKAPLDESKVIIEWKKYTDEWGNKFPDGESYDLEYPEVTLAADAVYAKNEGVISSLGNYKVLLESTIGIYGTGLLDAISDDDLKAQYAKEEQDGYMQNGLNEAFFKNGEWVKQYSNTKVTDVNPDFSDKGEQHPFRFTYALSRGPLQDAAGANAMWNITNVTRSNRRYHYLDTYFASASGEDKTVYGGSSWVKASANDPEVQAGYQSYIEEVDPDKNHPTWHADDYTDKTQVARAIAAYLTSQELDVEMDDEDFIDFMVWHRGLAVPAARNVDDPDVITGKELFEQIGCAYCHRPSWTTGDDNFYDPNGFFTKGDSRLPRYPNQAIWPYSDLVQHKLHMENDIRTGWCRTTPLWGRGLHQMCTGSATADRLHDNRARNVIEAIMWHGNTKSDARMTVEKFRNLSKAERDAIVKFIDSI